MDSATPSSDKRSSVEFYLYPTVITALIHLINPESQYSTAVLTVVKVMIAMYRK